MLKIEQELNQIASEEGIHGLMHQYANDSHLDEVHMDEESEDTTPHQDSSNTSN